MYAIRSYYGDHNVFMSGNDGDAKNHVKEILKSFGWKESNIIDLGDVITSYSIHYTKLYEELFVAVIILDNDYEEALGMLQSMDKEISSTQDKGVGQVGFR